MAEGKSSKGEIATLLNLSVYTVETHRARVMQKLNLRGIPELILYAVRKGIISWMRGINLARISLNEALSYDAGIGIRRLTNYAHGVR